MNEGPARPAAGASNGPDAPGRFARRGVLAAGAAALAAVALPAGTATAAPLDTGTGTGTTASDLQPYASYWYPDSLPPGTPDNGIVWRGLKSWTAESDPDLAFNASTVPLAPRFTPVAPNTTARSGQARVSALVSFGPTSLNPSQGGATADFYALSHWAYIDELVFWGGSSGEGLILAPNAPVVDAAHRNGVPVLGNIYLPPTAYGGRLQWTQDLVQHAADGTFPVADKLIQVATAYGFDGWFVNAETGGGDTQLGTDMRDFTEYLRDQGKDHGLKVTWYDSMTSTGAISWQNALDTQNSAFFQASDTMFLNFWWSRSGLASSAQLAQDLERDPYELWAGIDTESGGYNTSVDWDAVVPAAAPHIMSYGFYRPEWTWTSLPSGQRTPAAFHTRDDRFWTGPSLDPAAPDSGTGSWRAPALSVADRSTIRKLPFATTFNTGHGDHWYDRGVPVSDTPWNHLGLQDRLPGRRWVVRTDGARPLVNFDFADAWHGGSSLLVNGALTAPATVELHSVRLPLSRGTVVDLTHRIDPGSVAVTVDLAVATAEPAETGGAYAFAFIPAGTIAAGSGGWTTATLRVGALLKGRIHALGIRLTTPDGGSVQYRLGALAVRDTVRPHRPHQPHRLRTTASRTAADGTAGLRLAWDRAPGQIRHYEVHQLLPDGTRRFLGGTPGTATYVPALRRSGGEATTSIEVRSVDELFASSAPATVTYTW